ncbi:hypothetical protein Vretimale_19544, partial [Volvox reticuliferus]
EITIPCQCSPDGSVPHTVRRRFARLPRLLAVHVDRVAYVTHQAAGGSGPTSTQVKLNTRIDVTAELDMSSYCVGKAHTDMSLSPQHEAPSPATPERSERSAAYMSADVGVEVIDCTASSSDDPATQGAVFFAVCRGKVSEGLDFSDRAGRAVVITGIPYAVKNDAKVRLKRDVLDEEARAISSGANGLAGEGVAPLTGEAWYTNTAMRAVNQAMGRVIRHRWDYGAILLPNSRYAA